MCWRCRQACCAGCSRSTCRRGVELPEWCAPMTLHQYQNRAFEQPRSVLEGLIHPDKYTRARRPGIGDWTIAVDQVIIGIEPLGARRIRDEIPNWILNRPVSISGQIVLKKEPLDSFLGQITRPPQPVPLVLSGPWLSKCQPPRTAPS